VKVKIVLYLYKDDIYVQVKIGNYDSFYISMRYVCILFFLNFQVKIENYDLYLYAIISQNF
jgi:hypothetical protein